MFLLLLLAALAAWQWLGLQASDTTPAAPPSGAAGAQAGDTEAILQAFRLKRSGVTVNAQGEVVLLMNDDTQGTPHQHFLVRLEGADHTVKMAHNLDLAERVPVRVGDEVRFRGRYEYNVRGGVVHWTHHDPAGRGRGGWIEHAGRRYE